MVERTNTFTPAPIQPLCAAAVLLVTRAVMLVGVIVVVGVVGIAVSGCASSSAGRDGRPTAECPVCRCNNDLGCLVVRIDEATPRSVWQDRTYYFCSPECKTAFDRAPQKFVVK
jgi:YHS domain-containing protein